jgi:DNA recombination protein RmuC
MIIRLHNERVIVVDAKAPYATYIDAMAITDDTARMNRLRAYTRRIQDHINDLAKKEYWQQFQPAPLLVVLFLPNEAMFRAAFECEPNLFDIGTRQNVLLASPITLIALLKTVAYGWSQENRARSVQQIVNESQSLYKELSALRTQWDLFRGTLNRTNTEYNSLTRAYMTKVFPIVQRIRGLDGTLGNDVSKLQVNELQRVLEKVEIEEVRVEDKNYSIEPRQN